jgi:hypothetical protein
MTDAPVKLAVDQLTKKFGSLERKNVEDMARIRLKRKILGD